MYQASRSGMMTIVWNLNSFSPPPAPAPSFPPRWTRRCHLLIIFLGTPLPGLPTPLEAVRPPGVRARRAIAMAATRRRGWILDGGPADTIGEGRAPSPAAGAALDGSSDRWGGGKGAPAPLSPPWAAGEAPAGLNAVVGGYPPS